MLLEYIVSINETIMRVFGKVANRLSVKILTK